MKKRKFKESFHCTQVKSNIIEKQSYCGIPHPRKDCQGCIYRQEIDHSNDFNPFNAVNKGNLLIDTGCKRSYVLNDILTQNELSTSDIRIIKRNLKYRFK